VVPAEEFRLEAGALLGLGGAVGTTGSTQVVRQFAACELQLIMQLVVVKVRGVCSPGVGATTFGVVVCASTGTHAAAKVATAKMTPKALMSDSLTDADGKI
jgi:hypothetical protein